MGEPVGIDTALTGTEFVTSHSASDSTLAGSVKAAIIGGIESLASRNFDATGVLLNPGDAAHALLQGSNEAGPWAELTSIASGLRVFTTTNVTSGTAYVGDFSQLRLYVGQGYRVDVSTEAGARFDLNETGFRAEVEIAFDARPVVETGAIQKITGLIP